jgi:alkylated DNA repair dioxygenase AlkB
MRVITLYDDCEQRELFDTLLAEVPWKELHVTVYGKTYPQPRLTAWMGDKPYRYSGLTLEAQSMTPTVERVARDILRTTSDAYNSVLCNLYRDGSDAMGYHSDNEPELGDRPQVASVSLGDDRVLRVRPKRGGGSAAVVLRGGELLVMPPGMQDDFEHAIVRTRKPCGPRINLTYRNVV